MSARRRLPIAIAALLACSVAAIALFLWLKAPPIPAVDLAGVDPAVREAVEGARARARDAPRAGAAWGELGMVFLAHDFIDAARSALAEAERLEPADPRWPYLQGLAFQKGVPDPAVAIACFERAARKADQEPLPKLRLADELLQAGRVDEAAARFKEALKLAPADPRAELGLARVAQRRQAWAEALDHLKRSVVGAPRVRATHALLAEIHFRLGDREAAERERRAAAALPDIHRWPDLYEVQVYHRWAGALSRIERADGLYQSGRRDEALDLLRKTAREQPGALLVRLMLGRLLLQAGQAAAAEEALREAVGLAPDSFEAHNELAAALEQQGKAAEAAESYRRTIERKPDYGPAHASLAQCLLRLGQPDAALAALKESLRFRPDSASVQRQLGSLLAQKGQRDEALEHLQHAVRLNPADREARRLLEAVLAQEGR